jgi:flagellar hook assembly protein FlgD
VLAPDLTAPIQIRYRVADPVQRLRLCVYDARGRLVRVLANAPRTAGTYTQAWDGLNDRGGRSSAGVYIVWLQAPGASDTRKVVVLPEPNR